MTTTEAADSVAMIEEALVTIVREVGRPRLQEQLAREAGVACDAHYAMSDFPATAIVRAVEQYGCDAIVMGSHGRKGLSKLLLGSQTQQVLVSTHVPVLVTH